MTSIASREDVRFKAYELGIKNPKYLNLLMTVVDSYVSALVAKRASELYEEPLPLEPDYLCRGCNVIRPVSEFPPQKRYEPSTPISCIRCQGKSKYKCTGPCRQMKALSEFPVAKQLNPRKPSPCAYCADKVITMRDAGHNLPARVLLDP